MAVESEAAACVEGREVLRRSVDMAGSVLKSSDS